MLYKLIKVIFSVSNRFYFRTFQVSGLENIPGTGPVLLVANHPSAFMDPIVIATIAKRPLFFLAKGSLFQKGFTRWLLPKFNMIPIFRSEDSPGQMHKNKEVFLQCYKHFENNGQLLVFPEGISLTERRIKKVKTGTARIALGAESENQFKLGIRIVTVGLNFSNPHRFQSDLFINIDKPIEVSAYKELFETDAFKAVHALTDEIRKRLETQVIAIQEAEVDKLVANIEMIYKSQLLRELGHSPNEKEKDFITTRDISDSVHYFLNTDPERVARFKNEINAYLKDIERLSLNDGLISSLGGTRPLFDGMRSLFYLIAGFPLFAFGFINNYLPFKIPGWIAKFISRRAEFFGSIAISLGTFTFILFYSLQVWLISKFVSDWILLSCYAILLPVSGLFAFYYFKRFTTIRGNWKVFRLFYRKSKLISALILRRLSIIEELEKGKKEFLAQRDAQITPSNEKKQEFREDLNNFFSLNI